MLNANDRAILRLLMDGTSQIEIALMMGVGSSTLQGRLRDIRAKAGARTLCHAIAIALRSGEVK